MSVALESRGSNVGGEARRKLRQRNVKLAARRRRQAPSQNGLYVHSSPPRAVQVNPSLIRQWLRAGDVDKLEQVVLEGQGHKLLGEYNPEPRTRAFLRTVPQLMSKIDSLHQSVVNNSLSHLQNGLEGDEKMMLGRKDIALGKDRAGLSLLHKAVGLGHQDIAAWLASSYPPLLNLKDREGRNPLHYCSCGPAPEDMWDVIAGAGADQSLVDNQGHSPPYYLDHPEQIRLPEADESPEPRNRFLNSRDGLIVSRANIRIWIHDRDLGRLQQVLWDGHGSKLRVETSNNPRVKRFLDAVPYIMGSIKDTHQAVINNDQTFLEKRTEDPVPANILSTKDENGLTPMHKAAGLGQKDMLEWMVERFPNGINVPDAEGRTPLHWAARDPRTFAMLMDYGANPSILDYKNHEPSFYKGGKASELDQRLLRVVPDAPRTTSAFPPAWDWRMLNHFSYDAMSNPVLNDQVQKSGEWSQMPSRVDKALALGMAEEGKTSGTGGSESDTGVVTADGEKEAETTTEAEPEAEPETQAEPETETEIEPETEAPTEEAETEKKAEPEEEVAPEETTEAEAEPEEEPEPAIEAEPEAEAEQESEPQPEAEEGQEADLEENAEETNVDEAEPDGENAEESEEQTEAQPEEEATEETPAVEQTEEETEPKAEEEKEDEEDENKEETEENSGENNEAEAVVNEVEIEKEESKEENEEENPENEEETEEKTEEEAETENNEEEANADGEAEANADGEAEANADGEAEAEVETAGEGEGENEAEANPEAEGEVENEPDAEGEAEAQESGDVVEDGSPVSESQSPGDDSSPNIEPQRIDEAEVLTLQRDFEPVTPSLLHHREHDAFTPSGAEKQVELEEGVGEDDDEGVVDDTERSPFAERSPSADEDTHSREDTDRTDDSGMHEPGSSGSENGNDPEVAALIEAGDMEGLAALVLNGQGWRLANMRSRDAELQTFLNNVPQYISKIRAVHIAAREGRLRDLQASLDRRKFAVARDPEVSGMGATPLHVATLFGHTNIVRYLGARFPETLNTRDNNGRTPLHYGATIKDNGHYYNLLTNLGANAAIKDLNGKPASYYQKHPESLSHEMLLHDFGLTQEDSAVTTDYLQDQIKIDGEEDLYSSRRIFDDPEALSALDRCFQQLREAPMTTSLDDLQGFRMLKKHLRRPIYEEIHLRQTFRDHSLLDVIWPGSKDPENCLDGGVYCPDFECYYVFRELLEPIIKDMHGLNTEQPLPEQPSQQFYARFEGGQELQGRPTVTLDPDNKYVDWVKLEATRNFAEYPPPVCLSLGDLEAVEREVNSILEIPGSYYSLSDVFTDSELKEKLQDLLIEFYGDIENFDEVLQGSHWPTGRGVFLSEDGTTAIWVNILDHMRIVIFKSGGEISAIYHQMAHLLKDIKDRGEWATRANLGFLSTRPYALGHTLRFTVAVQLPKLGKEPDKLRSLGLARGLRVRQDKENPDRFFLKNRQSLGSTEMHSYNDFSSAASNIVDLERASNNTNPVANFTGVIGNIFRKK